LGGSIIKVSKSTTYKREKGIKNDAFFPFVCQMCAKLENNLFNWLSDPDKTLFQACLMPAPAYRLFWSYVL
jgi:hypothetical protein